jgi:hypothetical protein
MVCITVAYTLQVGLSKTKKHPGGMEVVLKEDVRMEEARLG